MMRSDVRKVCSGGRAWRTALAVLLVVAALAVPRAEAEDAARVELNSASAEELATLPGVGPAKAQAIIAYRETSPFKSAEELVEVKGIGEKLFAQLKDKVTVAAPAAGGARAAAPARSEPAAADAKAPRTAAAGAR